MSISARKKVLDELSLILSSKVTEFLPGELQFQTGKTDVETWVSAVTDGSTCFLARTLERDELAGVMIVHEIVQGNGTSTLRLGYLLGENYWGRGLATELVRRLVAKLEEIGFTGEVLGGVEPENAASASVLAKSGFTAIGGTSPLGATLYRRVFA